MARERDNEKHLRRERAQRAAAFCKSLDEVGYDDPLSLNCVLCGRPYIGLDWWSLGKVIGPCCSFGECGSCRQAENSR